MIYRAFLPRVLISLLSLLFFYRIRHLDSLPGRMDKGFISSIAFNMLSYAFYRHMVNQTVNKDLIYNHARPCNQERQALHRQYHPASRDSDR